MLCLCSSLQPWCWTDFKLSQQSKSKTCLKCSSPNVFVSRAVALYGFMFAICCIFLLFRLYFSKYNEIFCIVALGSVFISKLGLTCKSRLRRVLIQVILKVLFLSSLDSYTNIISTLDPDAIPSSDI